MLFDAVLRFSFHYISGPVLGRCSSGLLDRKDDDGTLSGRELLHIKNANCLSERGLQAHNN